MIKIRLSWKLALVLKGHASEPLLSTYASERKPVAQLTVEQAFSRYVARTAPWLPASPPPQPMIDDVNIELGYLYHSSQAIHADPRTTCGMPGSRAPHLWLTRADERVSALDLVKNFTLLSGPDGGDWTQVATAAASDLNGLPLDSYCIGKDVKDPDGLFSGLYGVGTRGASLVRPDGFIAWRSAQESAGCHGDLRAALARSVCRTID